jgi:RimJ/RimL family protein N-acetyltransferase
MQAARGHSLYIVEHAGRAIGMCGLIQREELDGIDLGYAFLPESQGQGFACEAGQAVLEYANKQLGMRRILAIVSPGNDKSISVLQKLGFSFVKIIHLRATDSGIFLYESGNDTSAAT